MVMSVTSKDLSLKEHRWELVPSGGTVMLEGGIGAIDEQLYFNLGQQQCAYYIPAFRQIRKYLNELPISSGQRFALATDDDFISFTFDEGIKPIHLLENEIVVKMPAKRSYTIQLEIRNVKKAEPKIVEP